MHTTFKRFYLQGIGTEKADKDLVVIIQTPPHPVLLSFLQIFKSEWQTKPSEPLNQVSLKKYTIMMFGFKKIVKVGNFISNTSRIERNALE